MFDFLDSLILTNVLLFGMIFVLSNLGEVLGKEHERNDEFRNEEWKQLMPYIRQINDRVTFTDSEKKKDAKERKEAQEIEDSNWEEENT